MTGYLALPVPWETIHWNSPKLGLLIFAWEEEPNYLFDILIFVSVGVSKQYCVVFMCLTVGACTFSSVMFRKLDIV